MPHLLLKAAFSLALFIPAASPAETPADWDAVAKLEAVWHGAATAADLETMLADDFLRPMPNGKVWTKADQVAWLKDRPAPPGIVNRFDRADLRFYGDTAVATGIAALVGPNAQVLDRTLFTSVYAKRGGKWQLISAHRSQLTPPAK